jgi:MFS family permease
VVLTCMVVFGLGIASLSLLTSSLARLYATFFILGVFGNGTTQMGYSRAVSSWFVDKRGKALALVMAGAGAGSIFLPALAQWLIDAHGWRTAYRVLGAMVLVIGIPLTAAFVRERPGQGGSCFIADGLSVRDGVRSRAFWLLVATLFLSSIAINGTITHLSPLLTDRGISPAQAAIAVSVLGGASLAGRLLTGHLLDRYFGPRVSFLLLISVAAGILVLATTSSPATALLAVAMIGVGMGGEADVTPYLLTRYFGLRAFSTLYGFTWTAYAFAGAVGPVLMGRVFDATKTYTGLLSVLVALTAASAICTILLPAYPSETRRVPDVSRPENEE